MALNAVAQDCLPDGATFDKQSKIDQFVAIYPNCINIMGDIVITSLGDSITDLSGLSKIQSIAGDLEITKNPLLTNLSGLDNLGSIEGRLIISLNSKLTNLDHLNNLQKVSNGININRNDGLEKIVGLSALDSVANQIRIVNNPKLSTINGIENLSTPTNIIIRQNDVLTSLSIANSINSLYDVWIDSNLILNELNAFANLQNIRDTLRMLYLPQLTSLDAFNKVRMVGGNLNINNNANLQSVDGLNALESVGNSFQIKACNSLINIDGLNALEEIGDNFRIADNSVLEDISGFENLREVGEFAGIIENPKLKSINGLHALTTISGGLLIEGNPLITTLANFELLTDLSGFLAIKQMDNLTSLEGLNELKSELLSTVMIANNQNLDYCHIESICNYLGMNGDITIENNMQRCNNISQVETLCSSSAADLSNEVIVFPNPASKFLMFTDVKLKTNRCSLIHHTGQSFVIKIVDDTADIQHLPPGLYFGKVDGMTFKWIKN